MFDIGFWELVVIGVIALLVIGPERLPGVARNVGLWVGRVRRYVAHVKRDIEREIHADEVRKMIESPGELDELRSIARETASVLDDTRREIDAARRSPQEKPAPASGEDAATGRTVAHQAVDEDPFAPASIARVSPAEEKDDEGRQPAQPADAPAAGDVTHDDEQSGRQGQR